MQRGFIILGSNNRRNGHSKKTVQAELGEIRLDVPRDRDGSFEPKLLPKYQRRLAGFDAAARVNALLRAMSEALVKAGTEGAPLVNPLDAQVVQLGKFLLVLQEDG